MPAPLFSDERFTRALALFDAGDYFPCHDLLEEMWSETLDENRQFLQGMIHVAVALFHCLSMGGNEALAFRRNLQVLYAGGYSVTDGVLPNLRSYAI